MSLLAPLPTRLAALLALTATVGAQLDLPRKPPRPRPGAAPAEGVDLPRRPRGDLAPGGGLPPLDLPGAAPAADGTTDPPGPPPPPEAANPIERALALFDALERERDSAPSQAQVSEHLAGLGPDGLAAARLVLERDTAASLLYGGRYLLVAGDADDRSLVARRLRRALPASVAEPLLLALLERDPVIAAPPFLVELLDHPGAAMRQAADRALFDRLDPSLLPFLAARLSSERTDTRLRALELVGRIEDTAARALVATRLGDPNARVAAAAVRQFAFEESPESSALLRRMAFDPEEDERAAAYALLALVEREDRHGRVELVLEDAPRLLDGLRLGDPILAGACASALAGVGFRTPASPATAWLDLEVPHTLVRLASGAEFHRDFSSLQPIALRRLALISGERFAGDGIAWRRWWTDTAGDFHARRAVLSVAPGDELALGVRCQRGTEGALVLAGPRAAPMDAAAREQAVVEPLLLSPEECADLLAVLGREGALGLERLPRRLDIDPARSLRLRVALGGQEKRFEFPLSATPAWAERVEATVRELAGRNAWQRYHDPSSGSSGRAFVASESAWWAVERPELERARRLKALIFGALRAGSAERAEGLSDLRRLYAQDGVAEAADVEPLVALAGDEPRHGPELALLLELLFVAVAGRAEPRLEADESTALVSSLVRHGEPALASLGRVLALSRPAVLQAAVRDPAPLVRRAAARAAVDAPSSVANELLLELTADADPDVASAAIEGLGERSSPEAREHLHQLVATAPRQLMPAVYRSVGRVGGEGARDVLMLGLAEDDPVLQLAALEGLGELADPGTTSLLVSVLGRGRGPAWLRPARAGLLAIGEPAWSQLERVMNGTNDRARREAALLLAAQGRPQAAPVLIALVTIDPEDERAAEELAILSCVDHREAPDPAQAWWEWWDLVVHDDSLAWLRAAAERAGLRAPAPDALRGEGTREGAQFLMELAFGEHPWHVAEHARRALERLLGRPAGSTPVDPADPGVARSALEAAFARRFAQGAGR